ncbi:MinD/ParA family ATP-binding protein [Actinomycetospora cinnamomea]|uniref:MinD-like ATPase involved in chromosome partitioning or flagellar assembly n=1 Tax=Actinomycetospora cinnamomea TaxID=663609 RepID=A0A2U1FD24_9PSEU|nr:MinD/ParA family protein [Actinomycetospora cinnamomea]PVZ10101.1 MinD-like ATPase involved in chromosome partitioning or flagellar assembly [Actinomycetospora cinnamomea]
MEARDDAGAEREGGPVRSADAPSGASPSEAEHTAPAAEAVSSPPTSPPASEGGGPPSSPSSSASSPSGSDGSSVAAPADSPDTTRRVDTAEAARGDAAQPRHPGVDPRLGAAGPTGRVAGPPGSAAPGDRAPVAGRYTTPGRGAGTPAPGSHGPASYDLSSAHLLRPSKRAPQTGWRRALFVGTGGLVNPGESPGDAARRELIARVNQPLHGCYKIAMLSLKGGVGKTTTTTTLGSTFASLRGDRVIAVDANPDRGTLSQKIPLETTATVRHLLRDATRVRRYSDVRAYTSQGPSRLEILASEQDPAVSEAFSEVDYRRTVTLLEHFYNVVLTDCGTGLMHSAMKGVLDVADSLLIVSSASIDGARSASATLDWLDAHGYRDLVSRSVAVINYVRRSSGNVDLDRVSDHFAARCRAVVRMPFDAHLEEGAEIELDKLAGRTRSALLELAATVADDFGRAGSRVRRPVIPR